MFSSLKFHPKPFSTLVFISLLVATMLMPIILMGSTSALLSGQDFNTGRIIDDSVFYNKSAMTPQSIEAFLISQVPNCNASSPSCLRDYMVNESGHVADQYCTGSSTGGYKIAAQVIWDVAQACSINPQVLIVLLQKEQGLVSNTKPTSSMYDKATGYACPDTASCNTAYYGLENQLYFAARQYQKYGKSPNSYSYAYGRNNTIQYKPTASCGSSSVYIQTQATANLYNYTPYQPNSAALNNLYGTGDSCSSYGNRNFWRLFTDWFGSTTDGKCYNGAASASNTNVLVGKINRIDHASFAINSGSGSGCVEFHAWNSNPSSWLNHVATNQPSVNSSNSELAFADLNGDGTDEAILVGLSNTTSGYVEFHIWNPNLKSWQNHIVSNTPCINPAVSSVQFADLNGDGRDEGVLIGEGNGSTSTGKIEFHVWNDGFQSFAQNIASNSNTIDPTVSAIQFADLNGDGRDEGVLIGEGNGSTSTGKIEFHVWNDGFATWREHITSNSATIDPAVSYIVFADLDNDGRDNGILIGKNAPTGSGNIEFHIWNSGLTSWNNHIVSNQVAPSS